MKRSLTTVQLLVFLLLLEGVGASMLRAQNSVTNKPLIIHLNEKKTRWIRFSSYIQLWSRINQNNPGTTVFGEPQSVTSDISVRRFRFGLQGQPTDRLYLYFLLGVNNLNYLSPRGTSLDLLDAYAEYSFGKHLSVGGGKSAWAGLSRYTSPSSSKHMSYDLPFVALPTLDATDDLIRKLSLHTKGKIGRIDYRFVLTKPFSVQNSRSFNPEPLEGISGFTDTRSSAQYAGYLKYEFWERESNKTSYQVGTYHGSKKVLNLGIGFNFQSDALWSRRQGDTVFHDMHLTAVDFFMDLPLNSSKKTAMTLYAAFFRYDFGPDYIRQIGANNPANGVNTGLGSFNGRGNTFPISGTGNSGLFQAGYLLPPVGKSNDRGQLQPYATFQLSGLERLADPMIYYDLGINWLFQGHTSRLTLNFQNRPVFDDRSDGLRVEDRRLMVVMQYQVRIE
ncbi:MAG: hypothetical protein MI921_18360 [Cytophagales bacterium]|nr:hypothetical protein [Cytophagales bacterium]